MIRTWTSEVRLWIANLDLKSEVQISRIHEVHLFRTSGPSPDFQVQGPDFQNSQGPDFLDPGRVQVQIGFSARNKSGPGSRISGPGVQIFWTRVESKSKSGFRPETNLDLRSRFSGPQVQVQICRSEVQICEVQFSVRIRTRGPRSIYVRSIYFSGRSEVQFIPPSLK